MRNGREEKLKRGIERKRWRDIDRQIEGAKDRMRMKSAAPSIIFVYFTIISPLLGQFLGDFP